jgi:hypothetical protein
MKFKSRCETPPVYTRATGPGHYVMSVAFSPDGRCIACGDSYRKEKAFELTSGAALTGSPFLRGLLGC